MASAATAREASAGTRVRRQRSLWWVVHSWVGLKLSLFMAWVLLTGTLAVFSVEMDWLARPALRVAPADAPQVSWGQLYEATRAVDPAAAISSISAPPHRWFAAEAMTEPRKDERVRVYLNPYSGQVQGTGQWMSFQRFFREMHRHLLLPARYGIPIVCSLSILLILSLVTGLVSYKKFWRGFLRRPRGGDARRLNGDLHRLGGLWGLWFVALIGLTGLWYLVESLGGDASYPKAPKAVQVAPRLTAASIDRAAATTRQAYPHLAISEMRLPEKAGDPIGFFGQADALLVRDRVNGVWIDPADGRVLQIVKGETLDVHQRISEMADPLHFGTWGGMTTKIIWFLFGIILTALAVTGAMIYSLRLKRAYDVDEAEEGPRHNFIVRLWHGMGVFAYPAAGIVLLSLAMFPSWLAG